jgi:hypothetical protein
MYYAVYDNMTPTLNHYFARECVVHNTLIPIILYATSEVRCQLSDSTEWAIGLNLNTVFAI